MPNLSTITVSNGTDSVVMSKRKQVEATGSSYLVDPSRLRELVLTTRDQSNGAFRHVTKYTQKLPATELIPLDEEAIGNINIRIPAVMSDAQVTDFLEELDSAYASVKADIIARSHYW